jgi:uncharacterized membrane protein HdeD (DUF308 family)
VQAVQLVAWATLGHGVLLGLTGGALVLSSPIMILEGEEIPVIVLGILLGIVWAVLGAAQVACGLRLLRRQGRTAALVVNGVTFLATICMCCAPTLALTVLSTVILSQADTVRWFEEGA